MAQSRGRGQVPALLAPAASLWCAVAEQQALLQDDLGVTGMAG